MALVHAYQKGKVKGVGSKVKKAAKSMTKTQSHDFMQKKAGEEFGGGRKPVDASKYLAIKPRRNPTPEDIALLEREKSKWFPDPFDNIGESLTQDMASPAKGAALYGILSGALGALAGKGIANVANDNNLTKKKLDPDTMAMYGGATTAVLAAMLAYYKRSMKNIELEDETLRLPPGATRRDRDWSPALAMGEGDNDYLKRVGAINAAMVGRLRGKDLQEFGFHE